MNSDPPRLPRSVETDPRYHLIISVLSAHSRRLWEGGVIEVPVIAIGHELSAVLQNACRAGTVVRGLENVQRKLADEHHGLQLADMRTGVARGARVSRLIVLSHDGAPRFYRAVETLLRRHRPRILALCIDGDAAALGEVLFGPGRMARIIMIDRRDAVSDALLALAGRPMTAGARTSGNSSQT